MDHRGFTHLASALVAPRGSASAWYKRNPVIPHRCANVPLKAASAGSPPRIDRPVVCSESVPQIQTVGLSVKLGEPHATSNPYHLWFSRSLRPCLMPVLGTRMGSVL